MVISFVDLQKISLFPKFGGCGTKIRPATPVSISNFSRAWQSYLVSYAFPILVNDRSLIGQQMIFKSFFVSVTGKLKFKKNYFFGTRVFPT